MSKNESYQKVITAAGRLVFPSLFEPKSFQEGMPEKYSAIIVFPEGTDLAPLQTAIKAVYEKELKGMSGVQHPIRNGNDKEAEWGTVFHNAKYIRVSTTRKPSVFDENCQPVLDAAKVYSGCIARAEVHPWAYNKMGNKGITLMLDAIQIFPGGGKLTVSFEEKSRQAFQAAAPEMLNADAYKTGSVTDNAEEEQPNNGDAGEETWL